VTEIWTRFGQNLTKERRRGNALNPLNLHPEKSGFYLIQVATTQWKNMIAALISHDPCRSHLLIDPIQQLAQPMTLSNPIGLIPQEIDHSRT
jgi:hypothetical protein